MEFSLDGNMSMLELLFGKEHEERRTRRQPRLGVRFLAHQGFWAGPGWGTLIEWADLVGYLRKWEGWIWRSRRDRIVWY